jgi:hypothetical protein
MWDNSPFLVRQVDKIGAKYAKDLMEAGIFFLYSFDFLLLKIFSSFFCLRFFILSFFHFSLIAHYLVFLLSFMPTIFLLFATFYSPLGVTSLAALEQCGPCFIETVCGRNAPFGSEIKDSVANIQKFQLKVSSVCYCVLSL